MKPLPLPLAIALALAIAAPAQAQRLTGDRAIDYGGIVIPASQALAPAGADHIAFRPACRQLNAYSNEQAGITNWGFQMPDGLLEILYTLDTMDEQRAHLELQAAGVCKFGTTTDGVVDVPIIYTRDLPVEAIAQPTAASTGTVTPTDVVGEPNSLRNLLLMGLVAAGIGGTAYAFMQSRTQSDATPPPRQGSDNDPFDHI